MVIHVYKISVPNCVYLTSIIISGFCLISSALSRGYGCLAHECGLLARGLAIAGEKWYGFFKSGTAFWKVVRLFRVSAIYGSGYGYLVTR